MNTKISDVKRHIELLADDYKCWDNRLTHEEAIVLDELLKGIEKPSELVKLLESRWPSIIIPARKQGAWIPVEDRMPTEAGEYFISWHGKLGRKYYGEYIEFGEYDPHDGWTCPGAEERGYTDITVTAWMPLPKPYREEETDEDSD